MLALFAQAGVKAQTGINAVVAETQPVVEGLLAAAGDFSGVNEHRALLLAEDDLPSLSTRCDRAMKPRSEDGLDAFLRANQ